jgi:hypothetical protein
LEKITSAKNYGKKETNLDTAEAEFLYANTLVELNKDKDFQKLSIP